MDKLQRYRNDVASNGPPPSPTASTHVSRPPRSVSSLTARPLSARPQLVLQTASPTRVNSSYRFPSSPSLAPGSPLSPRISRTAVRPNFPQHRNSNHAILAQLDSPNMASARGLGVPNLPAEYQRGRTGESSNRISAAQRSRSHGRPSISHTRSNSSMSSSTSSSSSSLFDRPGRAGSIAGSETSDDSRSIISVKSSKSGKGLKNKPSGLSLRSRKQSQTRIVREEDEDDAIPPVPPVPATATLTRQPTYGPTLWERLVATATATAKEWSFYGEGEDEDEPNTPGGETHLTAVLKTYYVDRARTRNDLPTWLFDTKERNIGTPLYSPGPQYLTPLQTPRTGTATPGTAVPATATSVASNQSIRDIYEVYAQSPATDTAKVRSPAPATRAQNRLRELRDAKRMGNLAVVDPSNKATMRPLLSAGLASRPKSQRVPAGPKTGRI